MEKKKEQVKKFSAVHYAEHCYWLKNIIGWKVLWLGQISARKSSELCK